VKVGTATTVMDNDKPDNAAESAADTRSFLQRYRLPLFLAVVALCLYVGSILYILYVRGPV